MLGHSLLFYRDEQRKVDIDSLPSTPYEIRSTPKGRHEHSGLSAFATPTSPQHVHADKNFAWPFSTVQNQKVSSIHFSTTFRTSFAIVGDTSIAHLHVYASDDQKESGSLLSPTVSEFFDPFHSTCLNSIVAIECSCSTNGRSSSMLHDDANTGHAEYGYWRIE